MFTKRTEKSLKHLFLPNQFQKYLKSSFFGIQLFLEIFFFFSNKSPASSSISALLYSFC